MRRIYELNESFDNIKNSIEKEKQINEYINEYINLKNKLNCVRNKIESEIKDTQFYFDEDACLLLEKKDRGIFLNYYFKIFNKKTKQYETTFESVEFDNSCFEDINKYLKHDKEKICEFLNNKELLNKYKPLSNISAFISKLFCGICSTNNIIAITKNDYKNDIIYSVKLNQTEYGKETFSGEIVFLFTNRDRAKNFLEQILR